MKSALRRPLIAVATAAAAAAATALVAPAAPAVAANAQSEQSTTKGFRKAVTVAGIEEHLRAFQKHADDNGGNRVAGSPGYEASATYVSNRLKAAGYVVKDDFFTFLFNADRTPPTFRSGSTSYVDGVDFSSMTFSENLPTTTAPVYAVDLQLPQATGPGATTSGCETSDFAGFPAGSIALLQRGTCTFATKTANAKAAGAVASIVFNDGGDAGRLGPVAGTLSSPNNGAVVGTSLKIGQELARGVANGPTGSTASLRIDRIEEQRQTRNIIAETPRGDAGNVVVVGAHLDSVPRGPGINDNGSGSAGILEIAEELAERGFGNRNKVRFAWWSAEEFGLLGSQSYVSRLSQAEKDAILLNLNFDMIGSPNYARFVYDGDNSAFPVGDGSAKGPAGSREIERVFTDYFKAAGLASGETPFSGRSDYGPFIAKGVDIPAGGLFTGAEGIKTKEQATFFGGTPDVAYDKCYHLFCDNLSNVNRKGLDEMSDAAAHATLHFAQRNLAKSPLTDPGKPVGGVATTKGGGGLHDDHDHDHEGDAS